MNLKFPKTPLKIFLFVFIAQTVIQTLIAYVDVSIPGSSVAILVFVITAFLYYRSYGESIPKGVCKKASLYYFLAYFCATELMVYLTIDISEIPESELLIYYGMVTFIGLVFSALYAVIFYAAMMLFGFFLTKNDEKKKGIEKKGEAS